MIDQQYAIIVWQNRAFYSKNVFQNAKNKIKIKPWEINLKYSNTSIYTCRPSKQTRGHGPASSARSALMILMKQFRPYFFIAAYTISTRFI